VKKHFPFSIFHFPLNFHLRNFQIERSKNKWKMVDGRWKIQSGQSLFEVVVALAISALVIVALVSLATNSIRTSIYSKNNSLATTYANQAIEWLRGERDRNMVNFNTQAYRFRSNIFKCFNSQPLAWPTGTGAAPVCPTSGTGSTISGTPFVRQLKFIITMTPAPVKTIYEADVTVSWTDSQGKHTVTSATVFTDWRQR